MKFLKSRESERLTPGEYGDCTEIGANVRDWEPYNSIDYWECLVTATTTKFLRNLVLQVLVLLLVKDRYSN